MAFGFYMSMKALIVTLILKFFVALKYAIKRAKPSQRAVAGRMKQLALYCGMEPKS